jgi:hypothetical protein
MDPPIFAIKYLHTLIKDNISHPPSVVVKNVHSFTSTPHISVPWWLGQEAILLLTITSVLVYTVISRNKVVNLASTNTGLFCF